MLHSNVRVFLHAGPGLAGLGSDWGFLAGSDAFPGAPPRFHPVFRDAASPEEGQHYRLAGKPHPLEHLGGSSLR
jgi:hypothetical protein